MKVERNLLFETYVGWEIDMSLLDLIIRQRE